MRLRLELGVRMLSFTYRMSSRSQERRWRRRTSDSSKYSAIITKENTRSTSATKARAYATSVAGRSLSPPKSKVKVLRAYMESFSSGR